MNCLLAGNSAQVDGSQRTKRATKSCDWSPYGRDNVNILLHYRWTRNEWMVSGAIYSEWLPIWSDLFFYVRCGLTRRRLIKLMHLPPVRSSELLLQQGKMSWENSHVNRGMEKSYPVRILLQIERLVHDHVKGLFLHYSSCLFWECSLQSGLWREIFLKCTLRESARVR